MSEGSTAIIAGAPINATGGVLCAPLGSERPTDAVEAFGDDWAKLGYVGEDGVVKTIDSSDEKIRAWGGDVVKVVRQDHSVSYALTFLESANATLLKAIKGEDNVLVTPASASHGAQIEIRDTGDMMPRQSFAFAMKDGDTSIREIVPDGQISVTGDATFTHADIIRYSVTIEAFPDEAGVKAYSYLDDGKLSRNPS